MKKLFLLLLLLPLNVWATTYWVRPSTDDTATTQTYGSGNGTNYANAYSGFSGLPTLVAGDTVCVEGKHRQRWALSGANGTSGNHITIKSCNGGGSIEGTVVISGNQSFNTSGGAYTTTGFSWSLVNTTTDLYKKSFAGAVGFLYVDGTLVQPVNVYASNEAAIISTLTACQWGVLNGSPKWIYYKSCDGTAHGGHLVETSRSDIPVGSPSIVYVTSSSYVDWQVDVKKHFGQDNYAGLSFVGCNNCTISNASFSGSFVGLGVNGGSYVVDNINSSYNYISGMSGWGASSTLSSLVIKNSRFSYNCWTPLFTGAEYKLSCDGDGVGIGQDGGTITFVGAYNNFFLKNGPLQANVPAGVTGDFNEGSGFYVGTKAAVTVDTVVLWGNTFEGNIRKHVQADYIKTVFITENKFLDVNERDATDASAIMISDSATASASRAIVGNTFNGVNGRAALFLRNNTLATTWEIRNNIFANSRKGTETDGRSTIWFENANANFTEGYNYFYNNDFSDGDGYVDQWRLATTEYYANATWTASGVTRGTSNVVGTDPQLDADSETSHNSPVVGAGAASSALSVSYSWPNLFGAYDIGRQSTYYVVGTDNIKATSVAIELGNQRAVAWPLVSPTTNCGLSFSLVGLPQRLSDGTQPHFADLTGIQCGNKTSRSFTVTPASAISNPQISISGAIPNTLYMVRIDGVAAGANITGCDNSKCIADATGLVQFSYNGSLSSSKTFSLMAQRKSGWRALTR